MYRLTVTCTTRNDWLHKQQTEIANTFASQFLKEETLLLLIKEEPLILIVRYYNADIKSETKNK